MTEERIEGGDGLTIFFRSWTPSGAPKALVVIVPGFNSHSGYYEWVAGRLLGRELSVYALDLRGRGKSEGERFYVDKFADYVADVTAVVAIAQSRAPGFPLFLLGHSAGGVVACLYALDNPTALSGLICESFAFRLPAPDFILAVLKGLSRVAPHARVLKLKNEDFSRDPAIVQAMNADPLIAHEAQPAQTLAALVRADERLAGEFPRLSLPLLVLHGTGDKAAKASGSRFLFDWAGSRDKSLKLYEGCFHDLLNDEGREAVMADIEGWIGRHLPEG